MDIKIDRNAIEEIRIHAVKRVEKGGNNMTVYTNVDFSTGLAVFEGY